MLNESNMSAEEYNSRGIANAKNGNLNQAIEDFNQAIELGSQLDPPSLVLVDAYSNRGAANAEIGNLNQAIEDFSKAIELNPNFARAYNNRGIAYKRKGDYDKAIKDCNKAIEVTSQLDSLGLAEAYYNRGLTYADRDELDQAIEDFNHAIQRNPNFADTYRTPLDQAIKDFNQAIQRNPNLDKAYNDRGLAYIRKGDFNQAIEDFNHAIQRNPNFDKAYNHRGAAYTRKGDFNQAIEDYDKAIEDYDKAIKDYDKAIQRNPNFDKAYYNRGRTSYDLGVIFDQRLTVPDDERNYYQEAVDDYDKAIELRSQLDPLELAGVYYNRSLIWLKWGHLEIRENWDKAKADLTDARDRGLNIVHEFFKTHGNNRNDLTDACAGYPPFITSMLIGPLNEDQQVSIEMNEFADDVTVGGRSYIDKVVSLRATVGLDAANFSDETISLRTNNNNVVVFVTTNEAMPPSILTEYAENTAHDFTIFIYDITFRRGKYYVSASIIVG